MSTRAWLTTTSCARTRSGLVVFSGHCRVWGISRGKICWGGSYNFRREPWGNHVIFFGLLCWFESCGTCWNKSTCRVHRYILKSGTAIATKAGYDFELEYRVGDFFGELALLTPNPRAASIHARAETVVLTMYRSQFMLLVRNTRLLAWLIVVKPHLIVRALARWARLIRCSKGTKRCTRKSTPASVDTSSCRWHLRSCTVMQSVYLINYRVT